MTKIISVFIVILSFLQISSVFSQGRNLPLNVSLIYPLSINQSRKDNVNINAGLIGSKFNNLKGLGVNLFYSVLDEDVNGVQLNGVYAETRRRLKGIQFAGMVNTATEGGWGIMASGLVNMTFDNFIGLQFGGISNLCFESAKGIQFAGLYNLAGKDLSVLQLSAAGNITGRHMKGVQTAVLFNFAGLINKGLQFSAINLTRNQHGVQFGLVNVSDVNKGFQFGVLNVVGTKQDGATLGLFYVYDNTRIQILLSGGNITYGTLGMRFKTNNIYTMLDFGAPVVFSKSEKSLLFTYRVGYSFNLKYLNFNTDLGFTSISSESNQVDDKPSKNQFGISFRAGLERHISGKFGLFANFGALNRADSYKKSKFKLQYIFEGGIVIL